MCFLRQSQATPECSMTLNQKYDIHSNSQSEGKGKTLRAENLREGWCNRCPSVKTNNTSIKAKHNHIRLVTKYCHKTRQQRPNRGNTAVSSGDFSREQRPVGENRL